LGDPWLSKKHKVEKMIYIQGTVKGSSVKLSDAIKVSDGSRVIVTILGANTKIEDEFLSEELENEDVEFVRACRGGSC
jgi:ferredoxin